MNKFYNKNKKWIREILFIQIFGRSWIKNLFALKMLSRWIQCCVLLLQRRIEASTNECQWYEVLLELHMKSSVSLSLSLSLSEISFFRLSVFLSLHFLIICNCVSIATAIICFIPSRMERAYDWLGKIHHVGSKF